MTIEPNQLAGDRQRLAYVSNDMNGRKNAFNTWFSDYPSSFTPKFGKVKGIQDFRKNLRIEGSLLTPGLTIRHNGKMVWRFGLLFEKHMHRLDSIRKESASLHLPYTVHEYIHIPKGKGKTTTKWLCEPHSLDLIRQSCATSEENNELVFHRTIEVKDGEWNAEKIKSAIPGLQQINKIHGSYVVTDSL